MVEEDVPAEAPADAQTPAADGEPVLSTQSVGQLYNPRVVKKSGAISGQVATWDCVWLGSYPQTEVAETDALMNANWTDSDATVGGVRYRRISRADALSSKYWGYGKGTYRYFRYEPIKWRILKVSGGTALAVADVALDSRPFNRSRANVTWEASTIRRWLNGTGAMPYYSEGAQPGYIARPFTRVAFSSDQLGAVRQSTIVNANNTRYGTSGGNDTSDRIFLLSESEVHGASATAHGFVSDPDTYDEARNCKLTDYAHAMGGNASVDNCWWWLRSPGGSSGEAAAGVSTGGDVGRSGYKVDNGRISVRPAVNLNLSSAQLKWAGTVSNDGTVDTGAKPGSRPPFSDVGQGDWYANVVRLAIDFGLMSGYGNNRFGPSDLITRGQAAVILWNMAGRPQGSRWLRDLDPKAYYYDAMLWAGSKGVVSGYKDGRFGPNDKITREQFAVMLTNYARNVKGGNPTGSASDYSSMTDRAKVSSWAVSSVGWCFRHKILSGSGGKVDPEGRTSRAQAAKMVVVVRDLLG